MATRTAITLGALIALSFTIVIAIRVWSSAGDEPVLVAATAPPSLTAAVPVASAPPASPVRVASSAPAPRDQPADTESPLGKANGNISFQRQPSGTDKQGASINFEVKSAIGVWQPGESRMRILLLESAPKGEDVTRLMGAVQSGAPVVGARQAVIELRFVPNAQAFDRNELDSATLVASDGGLSSTADALGGLSWAGSLPSPQVTLPPGSDHPTIELTSGGDNVTSESGTWHQSWRLSLAVPVVMRN